MPDETHESTGRTISFWMAHEEVKLLEIAAETEKVTRNEAARRAVRAYASTVANR